MAAWPTVAEVKQSLGVTSSARDAVIAAALGAAIEQVCKDCGYWSVAVATPEGTPAATGAISVDGDGASVIVTITPTYSQSQAALILAVMVVKAPDAPHGIAAVFDTGGLRVAAEHPTYQQLLVGERLLFGIG